jgi:hypothetical protein
MDKSPKIESRYKIEDINGGNGFRVWSDVANREPTCVHLYNDNSFVVTYDKKDTDDYSFDLSHLRIGLIQLHNLISCTADKLMSSWQRPVEQLEKATDKQKLFLTGKITKWAKVKTGMALAKKIKEKWLQLLGKADPKAVAAQRSYFAATGKFHNNLLQSGLYAEKNKYILQDIINYRAAAMTVPNLRIICNEVKDWYMEDEVGYKVVNNWMEVYSNNKGITTSLRKTLMNLPGGIPYGILKDILCYREELKRPLYTRLELLAYLAVNMYSRVGNYQNNLRILERSSEAQIRHALHAYYEHMRDPKRQLRKTNIILAGIQYIFDCGEPHNGSITGLAEKSFRWHREHRYNENKKYCRYPLETATKIPPVGLPENPQIKFLATVKDIFDEGDIMGHCVSSYTDSAVNGSCYLFHCEYDGEHATIDISPQGNINQARGPHNQDNKACGYAKRILTKWASKLRKKEDNILVSADVAPEVPF